MNSPEYLLSDCDREVAVAGSKEGTQGQGVPEGICCLGEVAGERQSQQSSTSDNMALNLSGVIRLSLFFKANLEQYGLVLVYTAPGIVWYHTCMCSATVLQRDEHSKTIPLMCVLGGARISPLLRQAGATSRSQNSINWAALPRYLCKKQTVSYLLCQKMHKPASWASKAIAEQHADWAGPLLYQGCWHISSGQCMTVYL